MVVRKADARSEAGEFPSEELIAVPNSGSCRDLESWRSLARPVVAMSR